MSIAFKIKPQARRVLFCLALAWTCLIGTGCETIIDSACSTMDYNDRVDYYKSRGCSQQKAEQGAFEDQVFGSH